MFFLFQIEIKTVNCMRFTKACIVRFDVYDINFNSMENHIFLTFRMSSMKLVVQFLGNKGDVNRISLTSSTGVDE